MTYETREEMIHRLDRDAAFLDAPARTMARREAAAKVARDALLADAVSVLGKLDRYADLGHAIGTEAGNLIRRLCVQVQP